MADNGIFDLRTPQDLLQKVHHDIGRLRANRTDTYAAFDFFVTCSQLPDWLKPLGVLPATVFEKYVELRICRHIGNTGKHFYIEDRSSPNRGKGHVGAKSDRRNQVQETAKSESAWGAAWGDSWGSSWGTRDLVIHLDPTHPDTLEFGSDKIGALEMAERLLHVLRTIVP